MCTSGPSWKREVVPDHKFDFVDTREFTDNGFGMRMKYLFMYLLILKSFLVYVSDIFSAITMLTTTNWSNDIYNSCKEIQDNAKAAGQDDSDTCIVVDFQIGKWVFFGSIVLGFLLLAYEARKAKKIIASRDISYAFTNIMANHYYSLRSYDHFCFFDHISNSTKRVDDFAFFVFFTFKGWKRLLLSDGPRQAINAITLYSFVISKQNPTDPNDSWDNFSKYFSGRETISNILICTIMFTVVVFLISLALLIVAAVCYIPLLCHVQGNLKEFCCHKVDKRIAEIIRRRNKQRQVKAAALARKEAAGDYSHLKTKNGGGNGAPLPQPTLPNVALDDDEFDDGASMATRVTAAGPGGGYGDPKAAYADYGQEYPPMPAFAPGAHAAHGGGGGAPAYADYGHQAEYGAHAEYYGHQAEYGAHGEYGRQQAEYAPPPQHADYAQQAVYGEREPYFNDHPAHSSVALAHADPYEPPPLRTGGGLGYEQDYPSPTSPGPPPRAGAHEWDQRDWDRKDGAGPGGGHGFAM